MGRQGVELIFTMSVKMHPKAMKEEQVVADTTAQEKNITYPTDGKQGLKVCTICLAIARRHNLPVCRSYRCTLTEFKRNSTLVN